MSDESYPRVAPSKLFEDSDGESGDETPDPEARTSSGTGPTVVIGSGAAASHEYQSKPLAEAGPALGSHGSSGSAGSDPFAFTTSSSLSALDGAVGIAGEVDPFGFDFQPPVTRSFNVSEAGLTFESASARAALATLERQLQGSVSFDKSFDPRASVDRSIALASAPVIRSELTDADTARMGSMSLAEASPAPSDAFTHFVIPPVLPGRPYYLFDSHFDVAADTIAHLVAQILLSLKRLSIACSYNESKFKFKCFYYSSIADTSFNIKIFRRSAAADAAFIVETGPRSGSTAMHRRLHDCLLAAMRTCSSDGSLMVVGKHAAAPTTVPLSMDMRPKQVPATMLSEAAKASPESRDEAVKPLITMLGSKYDDCALDACRTIGQLCLGPSAEIVCTHVPLVTALIEVLKENARAVRARTSAAIALDNLTKNTAGQRSFILALGLPSLLGLSPSGQSNEWHLRRNCLRILANLCCSTDAAIKRELSQDVVRNELARLADKAADDDHMLKEITRAQNGLDE